MMKLIYFGAFVCSLVQLFGHSDALSGADIAREADRHIGSTKWSRASSHTTGPNTNKCNIFVADVFDNLGVSVPTRGWLRGVIGAGEWGNPSSTYLSDDGCWSSESSPKLGDVVGDGVHVAIMTGYRTTTSASSNEQKVVKNDWGFKAGTRINAIWRYTC